MTETKNNNSNVTAAIQGGHGAFHEIATRKYFSNSVNVLPCETFDNIIEKIESKEVDFGVMAIENTLAGSLIPNYVLLRESPVKIIGEEYIRVKHNLVALPGQKIEDLTEVHSHYMAIAQCRKFFKQYPDIKLVESVDTALSAKKIQDKRLIGKGAIASDLAAELYGLEILAHEIETNQKNFTRFLILEHEDKKTKHEGCCTKASLCFSLPHHKGSLSQVLSVLAFYDLNLTKIQSMPIIGKEFKYFFYADISFDNYERFQQCIVAIKPLVVDFQILGEYKHGLESLGIIHHQ